jgi:hypothetical protein
MTIGTLNCFMGSKQGKTVGNRSMIELGITPGVYVVAIRTGCREPGRAMSLIIISGVARIAVLITFCRKDGFIGRQLMTGRTFYIFVSAQQSKTVGNSSMIEMGITPGVYVVAIGTGMREPG